MRLFGLLHNHGKLIQLYKVLDSSSQLPGIECSTGMHHYQGMSMAGLKRSLGFI
jgi:hypothetical protein